MPFFGFMGVLIAALLLIVTLLILFLGLRLNFHAMSAVMDALDEVSGSRTGTLMRTIVVLLTSLLLIFSCGGLLILDMVIIVIRANLNTNAK